MSMYSTDQRCPRCQYPITPGAQTCGNCGLVLSGPPQTPYGTEPAPPTYSAPSTPGSPFGPPPSTGPYGTGGYSGAPGYDFTPQPPPPPPGASSYYSGSQPPGFSGTAPAYLGSQPQPGFPTPGISQPPTPQRSGGGLRIAIIVLVVLVVLGGGGGVLAYVLTRPKPTIDVTSIYKVGSTPAGSTSTVLTVTGEKFSSNSTITFLLDGQPAPGNQTGLSDSNGDLKATSLTITADWGVGQHVITARDANNYTTQQGFTISIVAQGEANTPGPNGAPTDDTPSFNITLTVNSQDAVTGQTYQPFDDHLTVTGGADPAGGKVCNPQYDDGNPHTGSGTVSGINYTETWIFSCTGTYKGGKLSYTEHATSDQLVLSNGVTCNAQVPYVFEQLDGTFTDAQHISGTYSQDATTYNCSNGSSPQFDPSKGTWTGTV